MAHDVETGNVKLERTIHYAGDSTVQFNSYVTYPQTGLGQVLPLYIRREVFVKNHGKNGRSTKSFIDEGRLDVIANQLMEGDILFIQFGHNDEKIEDPLRYTTPFGTYKENLYKFIETARNKNAYPVLISPVERCHYENGKLYKGYHMEYVEAMKEVAKELDVPMIDLYSKVRALMETVGEEEAEKWHMPDRTHMTYTGAITYGNLIAEGLNELGGIYKDILLDELKK